MRMEYIAMSKQTTEKPTSDSDDLLSEISHFIKRLAFVYFFLLWDFFFVIFFHQLLHSNEMNHLKLVVSTLLLFNGCSFVNFLLC